MFMLATHCSASSAPSVPTVHNTTNIHLEMESANMKMVKSKHNTKTKTFYLMKSIWSGGTVTSVVATLLQFTYDHQGH